MCVLIATLQFKVVCTYLGTQSGVFPSIHGSYASMHVDMYQYIKAFKSITFYSKGGRGWESVCVCRFVLETYSECLLL